LQTFVDGQSVAPSRVRLSKHFLLSDFMGCDSVYTHGYPNVFVDFQGQKLREGETLSQKVLEPILKTSGLSVSYGYISPDLSKKIVKYQDPNKPSYHRWDHGAACDIVLHDAIYEGHAPIHSAFWIDEHLPVSRVITYSESPYICVASRDAEVCSGKCRHALYENRYIGERKPKFITYSNTRGFRLNQKASLTLHEPWEGAGYPTYHGGGRRQLHHIRTSKYTVLTDFLYSDIAVAEGYANKPSQRAVGKFHRAGDVYDSLLLRTGLRRLSIVRGYESPAWAVDSKHNWQKDIRFVVVPPSDTDPVSVAEAAWQISGVVDVRVKDEARVAIAISLA